MQMFVDELTGEVMPTWYPPTPPHDDMYIDPCEYLLYSQTPLSEDLLSDIIVKKERKRPKQEQGSQVLHRKIPRVDVKVPKSLFNRQMVFKKKDKPLKLKLAKPTKATTLTGSNKSAQVPAVSDTSPAGSADNATSSKPPVPNVSHLDWIVNEDWVLLQAVQQVLEMPLSLVTLMPAHTPNWHLVADLVNAVGCVYRSPKECKHRFESVIVPREEGKIPLTPKKKLKSMKFPVKTKMIKCHRMNAMHSMDNNSQFTNLYSDRFDACKTICNKRNPPSKNSGSSGQFQRNPKHTNILHDCGINYDKPLHPMQVAANRVKRIASQKKNEATAIQAPQAVTLTPNIPQGVTTMAQRVGGALVVGGSPVVGKTGLQVSNQGLNQLTAIPLSVGPNSIVVNSAFARRQSQSSVQAAATKLQTGKAGGAALTLRSLSGSAQHLQIPQSISSVQSVSLTFTAQSPVVTITTAAAGGKLSAIQHIRQAKQQSSQPTVAKQQVKQGGQLTMSTPQQSAAALMSIPTTVVGGKKVQLTKMTRSVTPHQLELLMKQRSQIKSVPHRPSQLHIAPIQAQVQAQHIRTHAAQQASQQHSSKPLPISVPVSAVSLTGLNTSSSSAQKSLVVPGGQTTLPHQLVLQQHLLKHRQMSQQQQQARQTQKTVYATVPSHQLLVSGGSTTVKMTPQIQAQMISQLVAQQQQQRRISNKQGASLVQPAVTLTVTKLLQSSGASTIRHTLVPHSAQIAQQVTQLPLSIATSMVTPGAIATHQQGLSTQQRQQLHMTRVSQVGSSQPQVTPAIIASTPVVMQRPSVVVANQVQQSMNIQISTPQAGLIVSGPPGTPVTIVSSPTTNLGETNFSMQPRSR